MIEQLTKDRFDPEQFHDEYRDRVLSAVEQKAAGQEVTVVKDAPQAQIIDLFEALKRSLKPESEAPVAAPVEADDKKPEVKKATPKREPKQKKATG